MNIDIETRRRFLDKVDTSLPAHKCWEYQGGISSDGRGVFTFNGKSVGAHRISYMIFFGDIPDGMCVCHRCDNGKCVNPHHLFLGTMLDNIQDMINKGRKVIRRGEEDPKSKLTNNQVLRIVKLYKSGEYNQYQIGDMFNVSRSTILAILRGDNWSSVTGIKEPLNLFERKDWKRVRQSIGA